MHFPDSVPAPNIVNRIAALNMHFCGIVVIVIAGKSLHCVWIIRTAKR